MNEIIATGDDEEDLGSSVTRSRNTLASLIVVWMFVIGVQQWGGDIVWRSPVAHADSTQQTHNFCVLKKDFLVSLRSNETRATKVADEVCDAASTAPALVDVSTDAQALTQEVLEVIGQYPMAQMADAIGKQDRIVAAFLVGIAKKESDFGKHRPTKNGADCYNYWGYKGSGANGSASGYACFATPEEAVSIVGARLFALAHTKHLDTPAKMISWKCGSSCTGHSPESVSGWIGTVDGYFKKLVR